MSKRLSAGLSKNTQEGFLTSLPKFLASPARSVLFLRILVILSLILVTLFRYWRRKTESETEIIDGMEVPLGTETYDLNID